MISGSRGYIIPDDILHLLTLLKFDYTAPPMTFNNWVGTQDPVENLLFGQIVRWNGTLPDSVIHCNYSAKYNPYGLSQPLSFGSVSDSIEWLNQEISLQELLDCQKFGPKVIKAETGADITTRYKGFRPLWVDELNSFEYLLNQAQYLLDENEEAGLINGYMGRYSTKFATEPFGLHTDCEQTRQRPFVILVSSCFEFFFKIDEENRRGY